MTHLVSDGLDKVQTTGQKAREGIGAAVSGVAGATRRRHGG